MNGIVCGMRKFEGWGKAADGADLSSTTSGVIAEKSGICTSELWSNGVGSESGEDVSELRIPSYIVGATDASDNPNGWNAEKGVEALVVGRGE